MQNINAALGVGCDHCHVLPQGAPPDFASDDKAEKEAPRAMMRITQATNASLAEELGRPASELVQYNDLKTRYSVRKHSRTTPLRSARWISCAPRNSRDSDSHAVCASSRREQRLSERSYSASRVEPLCSNAVQSPPVRPSHFEKQESREGLWH